MLESGLDLELLINRPSKLRKSSVENLAMSSDALQTRSSEPIDRLHLLPCMLNPGNPDGCTAESAKVSPRSVSISPVKERIIVLPPPAVGSPLSPKRADSVPCKKKCLCAPTTHTGSFRCRLHRLPPSPSATISAGRKGFSQLSSYKNKVGISQRSPSTSSSRGHEQKPSRLSRMAMAEAAQIKQATLAEDKRSSEVERSLPTTECSEGSLGSLNQEPNPGAAFAVTGTTEGQLTGSSKHVLLRLQTI